MSDLPSIRGVIVLFGDSGSSRFSSSKKRNHNTYRGVMILALDPDPESDLPPFGDS